MQTADCRSGKKCRLGTKCRLQTGCKMQTENSYRYFRLVRDNVTPYHLPSVTQSLFRDHLSRLFALLWNIPCPFLDHNIFFSLWVGWCDVCTEFTNLLKVDVDVNEMSLFENAWQSTALHVSVRFIFLTDMCSFCWQKCGPRPKLFLRLDIFSTFRGVHTLIFTYVPYIVTDMRDRRIFIGKSEALLSWLAIRLVFLPLICLVTTQILISENQTMWKLEILLLKTKDIKTRARNISQ